MTTCTEPVALQCGKLAAKYPQIYMDVFTVYHDGRGADVDRQTDAEAFSTLRQRSFRRRRCHVKFRCRLILIRVYMSFAFDIAVLDMPWRECCDLAGTFGVLGCYD